MPNLTHNQALFLGHTLMLAFGVLLGAAALALGA